MTKTMTNDRDDDDDDDHFLVISASYLHHLDEHYYCCVVSPLPAGSQCHQHNQSLLLTHEDFLTEKSEGDEEPEVIKADGALLSSGSSSPSSLITSRSALISEGGGGGDKLRLEAERNRGVMLRS